MEAKYETPTEHESQLLPCVGCDKDVMPPIMQCPDGKGRCISCYDAWLKEEDDPIRSLEGVAQMLLYSAVQEEQKGDELAASWLRLAAERLTPGCTSAADSVGGFDFEGECPSCAHKAPWGDFEKGKGAPGAPMCPGCGHGSTGLIMNAIDNGQSVGRWGTFGAAVSGSGTPIVDIGTSDPGAAGRKYSGGITLGNNCSCKCVPCVCDTPLA